MRVNFRFHFEKTPGFTLVELLVVVVIIGLLAGLSVPVIGRALDSAAEAEDINKLKQVGTGISIFETENSGRIPCSDMTNLGAGYGNFMEMVNRTFPPDSKFNAGGKYNWQLNPVWYSKRAAKMPAGQSFDPKKTFYWGIAWGMNDFLYYVVGWRPSGGLLKVALGFLFLLLFGYALSWLGVLVGLSASDARVVQNVSFIVTFPLTFLSNAFAPTTGMPRILQYFAEWNPVSTMVAACRELFGLQNQFGATAGSFPSEHPLITSFFYILLIMVIFIPLSLRKYRHSVD